MGCSFNIIKQCRPDLNLPLAPVVFSLSGVCTEREFVYLSRCVTNWAWELLHLPAPSILLLGPVWPGTTGLGEAVAQGVPVAIRPQQLHSWPARSIRHLVLTYNLRLPPDQVILIPQLHPLTRFSELPPISWHVSVLCICGWVYLDLTRPSHFTCFTSPRGVHNNCK